MGVAEEAGEREALRERGCPFPADALSYCGMLTRVPAAANPGQLVLTPFERAGPGFETFFHDLERRPFLYRCPFFAPAGGHSMHIDELHLRHLGDGALPHRAHPATLDRYPLARFPPKDELPPVKALRAVDVLHTPIDHFPTLASLCGLKTPGIVNGMDLSAHVLGRSGPQRDAALMMNFVSHWNYPESGTLWPEWRGIRTKQFTSAPSSPTL